MRVRSHSSEILHRAVAPLTIWALTRLLESRRVSRAVDRVDRNIDARKRRAEKSLRRVRKNLGANPILLTAGMIAIVAGVGLLIKAASSEK